jgi:hypothetical protein
MAISNLVKSSGYVNKPSIAGMFGKSAANDNLVKDSGLFSESFIVSASNSIMQLNDNLSKLQESSLSIIKSIDDIISKIRTLDKDMTQRFKKLNADITASRPEFGKFLVKAPPVPLADFAPGIIEQGKVANATGGGIPPIVPLPITPRSKTPGGGAGGGGGPRTQTPGSKGTTGSGKNPMKTAPKPATPTAKTSSPRPAGGVPSGTPSRTPEYKPGMMKPTPRGAPTRAPVIDGKTAARGALDRADRVLPRALSRALGPLYVLVESGIAYVKYQDAVKQYDTDIENKVDPKKAQETLNESVAEIIGETLGSILGISGGAALGGAIGTAIPGIGNLAGGLVGGLAGSAVGKDIGLIIGKSIGDTYKDDSVNFFDAFKKRWSVFSKGRSEETQKATTAAATGFQQRQDPAGRAKRLEERKQAAENAKSGGPAVPGATAPPPPPPPADSASAGEKKEEDGSSGSTSAPTGEAVPDPTKVKGRTPQSSTPAPSTPSAPPPTPRVDRTGGGGTNVQVNNTTNSSSTTRGGDNQNVTNPNMKLNAQNEFLTNSLSRQMIEIA